MSESTRKRPGFLTNVLWSWVSVATSFAAATLLAPYMFRRLGDEAYGIWALTFSIVEYFGLLDFGFKSAIIKNTGHFRARGDDNGVNQVLNSALAYFSAVAVVLCGVTLLLVWQASERFQISPGYLPDFRLLLILFGFSWALGLCFTSFTAALESFQRFDITSRITAFNSILRASSIALALSLGYGLRGIAAVAVVSQWVLYLLSLGAFLRLFPAFRLSPQLITRPVLLSLARFGWDTAPSTAAWLLLLQGPALLIGTLRPAAYVGYYIVAHRLVQTSLELVWRVGSVTNSKTAELAGSSQWNEIAQLAERSNRLCFALYAPIALGALVYGDRLLANWYNQRLGTESGSVLALLAVGAWFSDAGQFNSSSVLFGMAKQRIYSRLLLAEAIVMLAGMAFLLRPFGLNGVAASATVCMLIHRTVILPCLVCQVLGQQVWPFWVAIYGRTLLAAVAAGIFGWLLRSHAIPGDKLVDVFLASGLMTIVYLAALLTWALPTADRNMIMTKARAFIQARLGRSRWT